jgi:hypothetical protein
MYYGGSFEEANKEREVKHFRTRLHSKVPSKVQITKPNTYEVTFEGTNYQAKHMQRKRNARRLYRSPYLCRSVPLLKERPNPCKFLGETRRKTNLALGRYNDGSRRVESDRDHKDNFILDNF